MSTIHDYAMQQIRNELYSRLLVELKVYGVGTAEQQAVLCKSFVAYFFTDAERSLSDYLDSAEAVRAALQKCYCHLLPSELAILPNALALAKSNRQIFLDVYRDL